MSVLHPASSKEFGSLMCLWQALKLWKMQLEDGSFNVTWRRDLWGHWVIVLWKCVKLLAEQLWQIWRRYAPPFFAICEKPEGEGADTRPPAVRGLTLARKPCFATFAGVGWWWCDPPLGVSKRSVVELRGKDQRPADFSRRVLAIGGIIFGPRSIFDPVMTGQRSNFRKFHEFFVSRVHISKTIEGSGMKPSPVCSTFNSAWNVVFWCISVEYLGCILSIVLMNDTVSLRWRHRSNLWRHESATWHSNMIGVSVIVT